jgi:hypothetical protein
MPAGPPYSVYGDFIAARNSKRYWLDIDVGLRNLFHRQLTATNRIISLQQTLEYCVLEGVGAVDNALTVGQQRLDFDRFLVHIARNIGTEEEHPVVELRPSARMIWNHLNEPSPRLDIYIPNNISRHLVEFYVTKRIDRVQLSIQIAVVGDRMTTLDGLPEGIPLLDEAGQLHFRRTQCELLSVYTSLARN